MENTRADLDTDLEGRNDVNSPETLPNATEPVEKTDKPLLREYADAKGWLAYLKPSHRWIGVSRPVSVPTLLLRAAGVLAIALTFISAFYVIFPDGVGSSSPKNSHGYFGLHRDEARPRVFPVQISKDAGLYLDADFCSICSCNEGEYSTYDPSGSSSFLVPPRARHDEVYPSSAAKHWNEFIHLTLLDMYCVHPFLITTQSLRLLHRATSAFDQVASWSLEGLHPKKPTIYLTTVTSPNSKAGPLRPQYFKRHGSAVKTWIREQTIAAGQALGFQVLWVVAEDEGSIDPKLAFALRQTGIPHIYFSYGPTRSLGNAQKNAVLQMVNALSRSDPSDPHGGGLFGHGPVYGLDDDNKINPELLSVITKVVRCGVFPVGNVVGGPGGWEVPTVDENGVLMGSDSYWKRPFPFDYGAYAFNSSLLGTVISGPKFWKCDSFAGETEFLEQIAGDCSGLEPLCVDREKCRFVWHNEPLTDKEMARDED